MVTTGILALVAAAVAFILGYLSGRTSVKTKFLSDVMKVKENRSKKRLTQDAVLQLQNEIADSGAVQILDLEDGTMEVSIRVVV